MKPQKWRLSWCTFLFITASDFWRTLEPSHQTILGWAIVKRSYFLKPCRKVPFYIYQRKRKMNVTFEEVFFAFANSSWALFLERSYFIVDIQFACCYSKDQNCLIWVILGWYLKKETIWNNLDFFKTRSVVQNQKFFKFGTKIIIIWEHLGWNLKKKLLPYLKSAIFNF